MLLSTKATTTIRFVFHETRISLSLGLVASITKQDQRLDFPVAFEKDEDDDDDDNNNNYPLFINQIDAAVV